MTLMGNFKLAEINTAYNGHYAKNDVNLKEIERMAAIDKAFDVLFGADANPASKEYADAKELLRTREMEALANGDERYKAGVSIPKPWGANGVDYVSFKEENGVEDICIKTIVVKPYRQLSLQKHRGREEIWEVVDGTLTVNLNEKVYRVSKDGVFDITNESDPVNGKGIAVELDGKAFGKSAEGHNFIYLHKGSVHAMNNVHDVPVTVKETQKGITYEADNDRLIEALEDKKAPRATIPLISEMEVKAKENFDRLEKANASYWDNGHRFAQKISAEASPQVASALNR